MASNLRVGMIEAAASAYRAACSGKGDIHQGHKFDVRIDWTRQEARVTDEIGTEAVCFRNPEFCEKAGIL